MSTRDDDDDGLLRLEKRRHPLGHFENFFQALQFDAWEEWVSVCLNFNF